MEWYLEKGEYMFLFFAEFFGFYFIFMVGKRKMGNRKALFLAAVVSLIYFSIFQLGFFLDAMNKINISGTVLLGVGLFFSILVECFFNFSKYHVPYVNNKAIFSNKRVLAFVPHQDDEVNLLGTIPIEYKKNGSEFYIAFLTNGDARGEKEGQLRLKEALLVAHELGIKKNHVFFLGYGNGYTVDILKANEEEILTSKIGKDCTYALKRTPPFSKHRYTKKNMMEDIKKLIELLKPDTIFCIDMDKHPEHQILSQLFDCTINELTKEKYTPTIYKGFAYATAWTSDNDFYKTINIRSSQTTELSSLKSYKWEKRVRFPVPKCDLSRNISGCKSYWILRQYKTQNAVFRSGRIINGDKVFWRDETLKQKDAWIKFIDSNGDFLYDYIVFDNSLELYLYDSRWGERVDLESYNIVLKNNHGCKYIKLHDKLLLKFERKAECVLEVHEKNNSCISDAIRIKRANKIYESWIDFLVYLERYNEYRLLAQWYDFKYLIAMMILK